MNREACYLALFQRLRDALPGYWATRDLVPTDKCDLWPALIVCAMEEGAYQTDAGNAPATWRLTAIVALYLQRLSPTIAIETTAHAAIDAVVAALAPRPGEATFGQSFHSTLGDLVERVWVAGNAEIHRKPGDERAVVLIPVEMFTTS